VREFIGMSMHVVLCNSKKKVVRVVPWKNTCLGVTSATTWSVSSPPLISVVAKHSWTRMVLEYMTGPLENTCSGVTGATTRSVSSPPFISVVAKHSWTRTVLEYMTGSVPCLLAFLGVDT